MNATETIVDPEAATCYKIYYGYAAWFNCPNGAGRCGTCSTSRSDQGAWPAMDTCGCCTWTCCDCSKGCKNQIYASCGKDVLVRDPWCTGRSATVYIADCGPCQQGNCGGCSSLCGRKCGPPNCYTDYTPVIDLTKPTFARFRDPDAGWGCFPCSVKISYPC